MIRTQRPSLIQPRAVMAQPRCVMDKFDQLLMRAAENKRKDIINRYGHEGCDKLLAKGKQEEKKEDPELLKKNYESTIRNLLEAWEASPRESSKTTTKKIDKIIDSAWSWNLNNNPSKSPARTRARRKVLDRSRRHSLEV